MPEVYKKADFYTCCFQIIEKLCFMNFLKVLNCFQLNDYFSLNKDVSQIPPNNFTFVTHLNRDLTLSPKPSLMEFYKKSIFVNLLQKTET